MLNQSIIVHQVKKSSIAIQDLLFTCEDLRKKFADELKVQKSSNDMFINQIFLLNQTKMLADVQSKMIEQKLFFV